MAANKIIIYGVSPLAELMLYYFSEDSDYEVVAFCVDAIYKSSDSFCQLPLVNFESVTKLYPPNDFQMFIAIGFRVMRNRKSMFNKAKQQGYRLVNFISSRAVTHKNLQIGENNVILSSCDIEPFVRIGNNNIFWTGAIAGHHATIGDHNYISGGAGVGGNCVVGDMCFLGNQALMVNDINIANETFMVSGTIILKDTQEACQYHGNPAKLIGRHLDTGIVIP